MEKPSSPWMTPDEVKEYLGGVSDSALARYRRNGIPVHYVTEKTPRYHRDEVDAWVRKRGAELRPGP